MHWLETANSKKGNMKFYLVTLLVPVLPALLAYLN
jgi:hypothetical protein